MVAKRSNGFDKKIHQNAVQDVCLTHEILLQDVQHFSAHLAGHLKNRIDDARGEKQSKVRGEMIIV